MRSCPRTGASLRRDAPRACRTPIASGRWGGTWRTFLAGATALRPGDAADADRGVAILSSLPLTDLEAIELPIERQRRVALSGIVSGATATGTPWQVRVVSVAPRESTGAPAVWMRAGASRTRQTEALLEALALSPDAGATARPATLVGGDFNIWLGPDGAGLHAPARAPSARLPAKTRVRRWTTRWRLDYLFPSLPRGVQATHRRLDSTLRLRSLSRSWRRWTSARTERPATRPCLRRSRPSTGNRVLRSGDGAALLLGGVAGDDVPRRLARTRSRARRPRSSRPRSTRTGASPSASARRTPRRSPWPRPAPQRLAMTRDDRASGRVTTDAAGARHLPVHVQRRRRGLARSDERVGRAQPAQHVEHGARARPGSGEALPWDVADVPRGQLHRHFYKSARVGDHRDYYVYTPPGYDPRARRSVPGALPPARLQRRCERMDVGGPGARDPRQPDRGGEGEADAGRDDARLRRAGDRDARPACRRSCARRTWRAIATRCSPR